MITKQAKNLVQGDKITAGPLTGEVLSVEHLTVDGTVVVEISVWTSEGLRGRTVSSSRRFTVES